MDHRSWELPDSVLRADLSRKGITQRFCDRYVEREFVNFTSRHRPAAVGITMTVMFLVAAIQLWVTREANGSLYRGIVTALAILCLIAAVSYFVCPRFLERPSGQLNEKLIVFQLGGISMLTSLLVYPGNYFCYANPNNKLNIAVTLEQLCFEQVVAYPLIPVVIMLALGTPRPFIMAPMLAISVVLMAVSRYMGDPIIDTELNFGYRTFLLAALMLLVEILAVVNEWYSRSAFAELVLSQRRLGEFVQQRRELERFTEVIVPAHRRDHGSSTTIDNVGNAVVAMLDVANMMDLFSGVVSPHVPSQVSSFLSRAATLASTFDLTRVSINGDVFVATSIVCPEGGATRSCRFAKECIRETAKESSEASGRHCTIELRAGLGQGQLYGMLVGKAYMRYDVFGEASTAAWAVLQHAGEGEVLVTKAVKESCSQELVFEDLTGGSLFALKEVPEEEVKAPVESPEVSLRRDKSPESPEGSEQNAEKAEDALGKGLPTSQPALRGCLWETYTEERLELSFWQYRRLREAAPLGCLLVGVVFLLTFNNLQLASHGEDRTLPVMLLTTAGVLSFLLVVRLVTLQRVDVPAQVGVYVTVLVLELGAVLSVPSVLGNSPLLVNMLALLTLNFCGLTVLKFLLAMFSHQIIFLALFIGLGSGFERFVDMLIFILICVTIVFVEHQQRYRHRCAFESMRQVRVLEVANGSQEQYRLRVLAAAIPSQFLDAVHANRNTNLISTIWLSDVVVGFIRLHDIQESVCAGADAARQAVSGCLSVVEGELVGSLLSSISLFGDTIVVAGPLNTTLNGTVRAEMLQRVSADLMRVYYHLTKSATSFTFVADADKAAVVIMHSVFPTFVALGRSISLVRQMALEAPVGSHLITASVANQLPPMQHVEVKDQQRRRVKGGGGVMFHAIEPILPQMSTSESTVPERRGEGDFDDISLA